MGDVSPVVDEGMKAATTLVGLSSGGGAVAFSGQVSGTVPGHQFPCRSPLSLATSGAGP
jgi:hypothetical protein